MIALRLAIARFFCPPGWHVAKNPKGGPKKKLGVERGKEEVDGS
ncbi:MAG: hypothetical protein PHY29_02865 [Syntrophales bacterium]|nr:hypothetical protein [Syntrophales bacterium]